MQPNKEQKRPRPSATPTHSKSRSNPFTPRLSSTPQASRPLTAKKIRITSSHDHSSTTPAQAASKRFSKTADVSNRGIKEEKQNDDELEMDWGGCDDWEGGDGVGGEGGDGVGGEGGDGVKPETEETAEWDNWDDDVGMGDEPVKSEEGEEPVPVEQVKEEKTVV